MRLTALALVLFASTASAQAPDSTASTAAEPRVLRTAPVAPAVQLPPLAVQSGASALGYLAGGVAGYYAGDALTGGPGLRASIPSDGGALGTLVGTTIGAAALATVIGDRRGFWRALGGAAAGQLVGIALIQLPPDDSPLGDALFFALPIAAGVGAALGNRYGVEPRANVPAPGGR